MVGAGHGAAVGPAWQPVRGQGWDPGEQRCLLSAACLGGASLLELGWEKPRFQEQASPGWRFESVFIGLKFRRP